MTNALLGPMSVKSTVVGESGSGGDRKNDTCKVENLPYFMFCLNPSVSNLGSFVHGDTYW